jgi:hypothetical protein
MAYLQSFLKRLEMDFHNHMQLRPAMTAIDGGRGAI